MPVFKDASGRRAVQSQVEVPGTPDVVWKAVATGSGISSWLVPTQVEERAGGVSTSNFGPGMESVASITVWDPPRRFVATSRDLGPDAPEIITEWSVEPRSAGTCNVRVTHSLESSGEEWDSTLHQWELGWPVFFRILSLYLTHFAGRTCSAFQVIGTTQGSASSAWASLTSSLGISGARKGQRCETSSNAPSLSGVVEHAMSGHHSELLVRLDAPAPGLAHMFAMPMGPQVVLPIRFYLYGESAAAAAQSAEASWSQWLNEKFPPVAAPSA
jgi:hypothetical protein